MATLYRPRGRRNFIIEWTDAGGKRHRKNGSPDKAVARRLKAEIEKREFEGREGLRDPRQEAYALHASRPLSTHLDAWEASLTAAGSTAKHVDLFTNRARRVVALVMGAKLSDIEPSRRTKRADLAGYDVRLAEWVSRAGMADLEKDRVQGALATLRGEGRSAQTCNHHRAAIKAFSTWCHDTHRSREDALRGVKGYNVKEDRRHDRRTLSLDELHRLIRATERGPMMLGLSGPARALIYRLAASTGLRYSEIGSITPASFDWEAPSVTIRAAYTKNKAPATLPLPGDLVADLRPYVATIPAGSKVWTLSRSGRGAEMMQVDLAAAGIDYCDASGLFFDFHSLRCQTATLADAAGVSPRVVQKLMRHSTLELTGRYTRPRVVDVEAVAERLPSLKPAGDGPEAMAATGTEGTIRGTITPRDTPQDDDDDPKPGPGNGLDLSRCGVDNRPSRRAVLIVSIAGGPCHVYRDACDFRPRLDRGRSS